MPEPVHLLKVAPEGPLAGERGACVSSEGLGSKQDLTGWVAPQWNVFREAGSPTSAGSRPGHAPLKPAGSPSLPFPTSGALPESSDTP